MTCSKEVDKQNLNAIESLVHPLQIRTCIVHQLWRMHYKTLLQHQQCVFLTKEWALRCINATKHVGYIDSRGASLVLVDEMVQHFNTKIVIALVCIQQVSNRPDQHELAFLWSY